MSLGQVESTSLSDVFIFLGNRHVCIQVVSMGDTGLQREALVGDTVRSPFLSLGLPFRIREDTDFRNQKKKRKKRNLGP